MASTDPTGYLSIPPDLIRGVAWKQPVACATTANITLSGTQTIDGHAALVGERVLVKDQATGSQNGIYICAAGAWVRAFDMDQDLTSAVPAQETLGAIVYVVAGTVNAGTAWRCTNTGAVVLGTTAITFASFGSGASGFATPAIVLGTAAAAGAATTVIRSDATILAFDGTLPAAVTPGAGSVGAAATAARRDHSHPFTPPQPVVEDDGAGSFAFVFEANGEVIWE